MRKFIEKINNIIQWTKKFHFFHISFVIPFIITILIILIAIPYSKTISEPYTYSLLIAFISILLMTPLALIIEVLIIIIRKWTHKNFYVSEAITKNKLYNIIYIISILHFCYIITLWLFLLSYE